MFRSASNDCEAIRRSLTAGLTGQESSSERAAVLGHLSSCAPCSESTHAVHEYRRTLSQMPQRPVPGRLQTKLQVLASIEAVRAARRHAAGSVWRYWYGEARLMLQNLMRPLAVPTAGGFVSAMAMFAFLGTSLSHGSSVSYTPDVPTVLYTEASVKNIITLGFDIHSDFLIEVTVDDTGRMNNYRVLSGQRQAPELRRHIENSLLLSQFKPATTFGQPTGGKLVLWFRATSTGIDVKG